MNGAESLVTTLTDCGVNVCFANPGTSEMHFLAALENPKMKSVLCLFEGVCTGAADGYYRMTDVPASTLLHLGPGLANGLANIHNAKRASSGIVNIVGEHATRHLKYDAPLTSDIEGLARPLSHWVRRTDSPLSIASDAASAVAKARGHPGQIATLILPGDASWGEAGEPVRVPTLAIERRVPEQGRIDQVARVLRSGEPALIVLAGKAMRGRALELAGRIAARTGCRIATQFFSARIERGAGRVPLERIPYAVAPSIAFLAGFKHIITVETTEPIAFFAYPDKPSLLKAPDAQVHGLIEKDEDSIAGLEMLADALGARETAPLLQAASERIVPQGKLDPVSIARALAAALPEHAILVDESLTTGRDSMGLTAGAPPHDTIQNMGGSIGFGTPVSVGAAIACPRSAGGVHRRRRQRDVHDSGVVDAGARTARHHHDHLRQHSYQILKTEYANMDIGALGPQALAMIDIDRPRIDWVAMARSMGVPAISVGTAEDLHKSMADLVKEPGPNLIEVRL